MDWPLLWDGKLVIEDMEGFGRAMWGLFGDSAQLYLSITESRPSRSNQQLRYLFGVVYQKASEEWGYTRDEIHEICKDRFLRRTYQIGEEDISAPGTTKKLNTKEMTEFIESVRRFFAEHGLYTPDPNE